MCHPIAIGVAMLMGSALAKSKAQGQVDKARTGAVNSETARQHDFNNEIFNIADKSRDRFTDFESQRAEKAASLSDFYKGQHNDLASVKEVLPSSSSDIVVRDRARQIGAARKFGEQQDSSLAELRSFGDLLGSLSRDQARDVTQTGMLSGFKRGSQGVLPLELEAANAKGNRMKLFGDLLAVGGQAMTMYGMSGAGAGGGIMAPNNMADTPTLQRGSGWMWS